MNINNIILILILFYSLCKIIPLLKEKYKIYFLIILIIIGMNITNNIFISTSVSIIVLYFYLFMIEPTINNENNNLK